MSYSQLKLFLGALSGHQKCTDHWLIIQGFDALPWIFQVQEDRLVEAETVEARRCRGLGTLSS